MMNEQEHDAEFGHGADRLRIGDERQARRSDRDARREIAEHGAQTDQPEQRHGDDGGGAECQDRRQRN